MIPRLSFNVRLPDDSPRLTGRVLWTWDLPTRRWWTTAGLGLWVRRRVVRRDSTAAGIRHVWKREAVQAEVHVGRLAFVVEFGRRVTAWFHRAEA